MLSKEILSKIRQIEICTRRLLNSSLAGDSRSAVKGSGFEFDQIREYQQGDDIRFIDWKSSARTDKLLVKEYIEERNRIIIIAADISASESYSSSTVIKREVVAQITTVLSLVADYGKDQVGLLLFSDQVEGYIPPSRGSMHVRSIMEKIFSLKPASAKTDIKVALSYLAALPKRDALIILISDFIDPHNFHVEADNGATKRKISPSEKLLRHLARRHDMIALRCLDKNEMQLPDVGFLTIEDNETGQQHTIDTRSKKQLHVFLAARIEAQDALFKRCGIDCVDVAVDRPFVGDLVRFFRRRMMY